MEPEETLPEAAGTAEVPGLAPEDMLPPGVLPTDMVPPELAHDLSMLGLFMQADPIVKGVMLLLLLASIVCWAIVIDKSVRVFLLGREVRRIERASTAKSLGYTGSRLTDAVIAAGKREQELEPLTHESPAEYRERLERAMRAVVSAELHRLEPGLPFLATTGSAAPFIGLFGTVWGIMNSFTAIAQSQDTSLAAVAPGIAEALFATAMGLVAAIPAVIAYNKFATSFGRAAQRLEAAIAEIGGRLCREPAEPAPATSYREAGGWR